jgi:hypothetical protein
VLSFTRELLPTPHAVRRTQREQAKDTSNRNTQQSAERLHFCSNSNACSPVHSIAFSLGDSRYAKEADFVSWNECRRITFTTDPSWWSRQLPHDCAGSRRKSQFALGQGGLRQKYLNPCRYRLAGRLLRKNVVEKSKPFNAPLV